MYKGVKRALDITFSIVGTAVTSPILLAVAAAVKLDSKGPVIFKQERLGKDGKVFEMYKFRSMCVDAEHMGTGQYSYKGDESRRAAAVHKYSQGRHELYRSAPDPDISPVEV